MMHRPLVKKIVQKSSVKHAGISLLEMAMVMVVVSVALLPIMQTLNGARVKSGGGANEMSGPADRMTGYKSKEALMANTLIEQALAGDYGNFNCGPAGSNTFNPDTDFPAAGTKKIFNRCTNSSYNQPMYYQWTMYSVALPEQLQNQYYRASLNVYNQASGGTPLLTLQTNFFRNKGAYSTGNNTTGIMLALDNSGSMSSAKIENAGLQSYDGIASPFMFYRYIPNGQTLSLFEGTNYTNNFNGTNYSVNFPANKVPGSAPIGTYTAASLGGPGKTVLDKWDNTQLDIGLAQAINTTTPPFRPDFSDPNPATVANDKFPYSRTHNVLLGQPGDPIWGQGILGIGNCSALNLGLLLPDELTFTKANDNNGLALDKNMKYTFLPEARDDIRGLLGGNPIGGRITISQLCQPKTSTNDWKDTLNTYMSRFEAARSGALTMLLTLEQSPSVASTMQFGFFPWNAGVDARHLVSPESPVQVAAANDNKLHFVNMRDKLLWVNRADPSNSNSQKPVRTGGGTGISCAIDYGRQQLLAQDYGHRILVLMTDGFPQNSGCANNTTSALPNYVKNTIGTNAPDDKQITLFTVQFISGDPNSLSQMAANTPGGQSFNVTDLSQLNAVFESISYSIQKAALTNSVKRYGITL